VERVPDERNVKKVFKDIPEGEKDGGKPREKKKPTRKSLHTHRENPQHNPGPYSHTQAKRPPTSQN
jgi:hypothetical protein